MLEPTIYASLRSSSLVGYSELLIPNPSELNENRLSSSHEQDLFLRYQ